MEDFLAANEESRRRLLDLVDRLTDDDLALELDAGWTLGAVLAHIAFWDQRALTLIGRWSEDGVGPSPVDADAINDACRPLLRRLPPAAVRDLVRDSAAAIDAAIEGLTPSQMVDIQEHATQFHPCRGTHRNAHLDELEIHLARRGRPVRGLLLEQ
jgi:hypothetical protein